MPSRLLDYQLCQRSVVDGDVLQDSRPNRKDQSADVLSAILPFIKPSVTRCSSAWSQVQNLSSVCTILQFSASVRELIWLGNECLLLQILQTCWIRWFVEAQDILGLLSVVISCSGKTHIRSLLLARLPVDKSQSDK